MSVGIAKSSFSPQPRHVVGFFVERDASGNEPGAFPVEVVTLEVDSDLFGLRHAFDTFHREGRISVRALESQVVIVANDQLQAERRVEALGAGNVDGANGDLVESHTFSRADGWQPAQEVWGSNGS
jgi:hypothetical protein